MIKPTFAAIVLISVLTGTAYLYLPTPAPAPTTTVAAKTEPTSPRPGSGRERFHQERQPPETYIPLGLLAVGILWMRSLKA